MKFYVYIHRRCDTGEIFYVGKGCGKRAWKKADRNQWWKNIESKHGRTVEIIVKNLDESDSFSLEQLVIETIGRDALVNLTAGGIGGVEPSDETRAKMSAARKGRHVSQETREKIRAASSGRRHSEETKEKLRAANLGKTGPRHTDESRRAISLANKGAVRTPEQRAAISAAKVGRKNGPMSEKTKAALRAAHLGKKHSEESRRKMSESSKGILHSEETKAKMTEINRRNNASRKKPVLCSNGIVFAFSGDAESWLRENGFPTATRTNIVSCCTGRLKTAYGFSWCFAENHAHDKLMP